MRRLLWTWPLVAALLFFLIPWSCHRLRDERPLKIVDSLPVGARAIALRLCKTRLVDELITQAHASGGQVLTGASYAEGGSP